MMYEYGVQQKQKEDFKLIWRFFDVDSFHISKSSVLVHSNVAMQMKFLSIALLLKIICFTIMHIYLN